MPPRASSSAGPDKGALRRRRAISSGRRETARMTGAEVARCHGRSGGYVMRTRGHLLRHHGLWTALALATSGCGDLFHATDWSPSCDDDASDCAPSATGAGGGGSGAMAGAGGMGAASTGGAGGSDGGSPGVSVGGAGGGSAAGGAGGGACSTCQQVGQVVLDGSASPDPSTLCPGAAQEAWDAVFACICMSGCDVDCNDSACLLQQASKRLHPVREQQLPRPAAGLPEQLRRRRGRPRSR